MPTGAIIAACLGLSGAPPADDGARRAVDRFRELVATHCSYVVATSSAPRIQGLIDESIAGNAEPDRAAAVRMISRALGATLDGHASVRARESDPERFLPFVLVPLADARAGEVICAWPDRSGFLDEKHPALAAINGIDIETLIDRAATEVADGSPALVRSRACRLLSQARWWGPGDAAHATLTLAALGPADAHATRDLGVRLSDRAPRRADWPRAGSRRIDDRAAYLRLAEMDDGEAFLRTLRATIEGFADASALIIDVRGNGGGRRDALLMIASLVMAPDDAPIVYNAARPLRLGRTEAELDRDMTERFMRRADDPSWTERERRAVSEFARGFTIRTPGLTLDDGAFGPWYYGVLAPEQGGAWWKAGKRVVVLMDQECFSATDVFLSAMSEIDGVTLVGRPSSGGSGLAKRYDLGAGIEVRLSSMVSFRPDGSLLDGNGVAPDVLVWPTARDCIEGGTDTALERALEAAARP